ncbi:hypothetical protein [Amycolatopsis palatopharyngis]|uniref:hypothetical protein n=1 Tax=Amycolatopsis palatopharyngis TaxID=187982 RepID=UPI000E2217E0|nr:hypothetical protein [Amycolatopsis palatopharyngis]
MDLTELLEVAAVEGRPRRFAIYGTLKRYPDEPLLGWGIELPDGGGTLFSWASSRSVHTADSAARVLALQSIIGDVRLKWLDAATETRVG